MPLETRPTPPAPARKVPPLEPGDHLTREEFERRYQATPHLKKAELLEGVVYMPPHAVTHEGHGEPHFDIVTYLGIYRIHTPGVSGGDNSSLRLELDSEPQPDACLMIRPEYGGQARVDEEDYVAGAPELIVEVAASSASYDLHVKRRAYCRCGVREYVVWRTRDAAVDWFVLRDGDYAPLQPGPDGVYRSEVFPGLWIDPHALLNKDHGRLLRVLNEGLASPEHAAFVQSLGSSNER